MVVMHNLLMRPNSRKLIDTLYVDPPTNMDCKIFMCLKLLFDFV